jgi:hypothetical protein
MTIDNHCSGDDQFDSLPATHAEAHYRASLEQSARFAARLAIARWINSSARGTVAPQIAQAKWYAESQQNFQQWLGRGGFAQYPDDCADLIVPTLYSIRDASTQPARPNIPSPAG